MNRISVKVLSALVLSGNVNLLTRSFPCLCRVRFSSFCATGFQMNSRSVFINSWTYLADSVWMVIQ